MHRAPSTRHVAKTAQLERSKSAKPLISRQLLPEKPLNMSGFAQSERVAPLPGPGHHILDFPQDNPLTLKRKPRNWVRFAKKCFVKNY